MSDDTPTDRPVFVFCEWVAGALIFGAVEGWREGKPASIALVIPAIFFFLVGVKWPVIKVKSGPALSKIASRIERIASDYRHRTSGAVILVLIVLLTFSSYVHSLRDDLDTYVMPRVVTDSQADEIHKILSAYHSQIHIDVAFNEIDEEAGEYADGLSAAINGAAGWEARSRPMNPSDNDGKNIGIDNSTVATMSGIYIDVEDIGNPASDDPKHPTADYLLRSAFHSLQIDYAVGERPNQGKYIVTVIVGRRPLAMRSRSFRSALGQWIVRNLHLY